MMQKDFGRTSCFAGKLSDWLAFVATGICIRHVTTLVIAKHYSSAVRVMERLVRKDEQVKLDSIKILLY